MGPLLQNLNTPQPPAFLDPLYSLEDCYYYAVPKFIDIKHPHNRWLVGRIKANDADAIRRKLEITPGFFQNKYFQLVDNPALYFEEKKSGGPMYHNKCVLYLTPLGISIYMKSREVVAMLLAYRNTNDERLIEVDEIQFASHMQSPSDGDFHAFPPFLIAVRREFFPALELLQAAGWNPNTELALPIRRRYERRAFYFRDWLDVALHLLCNKAFYPMHLLINAVISAPTYSYSNLPLSQIKPDPKEPPPTPIGLLDVGDLPLGVRLTGVANLLEVAEQYDRYLQLQQTMRAVKELKREAETNGYNYELMTQMAYGPLTPPEDEVKSVNATGNQNNNARSSKRRDSRKSDEPASPTWYCSEPLRILLFSLEKDKRCRSLQQCMDAFHVYVKRGFFFNADRMEWSQPRARDQRNTVNCLLNMIRREHDCMDSILNRIRSGQRRFLHLEEHKVLENRRLQHVINVDRLIVCLAQALLHTKEVVSFLHSSRFPLYPRHSVDFQLIPEVYTNLSAVRFGIIREFNRNRNSWKFLTNDMLARVAKDSSLTMQFNVGNKPTKDEISVYLKAQRKRERMEKLMANRLKAKQKKQQ